jgi:hypothetical protein
MRATPVLLFLAATASQVCASNPGINIFSDWDYKGSAYDINYAPSGACVSLPLYATTSASSVRITGTSCCMYYAYNCAQDYFTTRIEQDESRLPVQLNDHLGSVRCFNGAVPATCDIHDSKSKRSIHVRETASLIARGAQSLESGLEFTGSNHIGTDLTNYVEDVHYTGGNGIPGGIIYSGGQDVAANVYGHLSDFSDGASGQVVVGGVTIAWTLNVNSGSEDVQTFLNMDMSQSHLVTIATDALDGMLTHGQSSIAFAVYARSPIYNGFVANFTFRVRN